MSAVTVPGGVDVYNLSDFFNIFIIIIIIIIIICFLGIALCLNQWTNFSTW